MKIGITLSFSDNRYALGVSHLLILRLSSLVNDYSFGETKREPNSHVGLDANLWINCLPVEDLYLWKSSLKNSDYPGVYYHSRPTKPRGYDWVEFFFRFQFEIVHRSKDKLKSFLDMIRECFEILERRFGIEVHALTHWEEIVATLRQDVLTDQAYRFSREEDGGVVIA